MIRAGYSQKNTASIACTLMKQPKVAAAIRKAMDARVTRTQIDADRVLREFARIAFADIRSYTEWDKKKGLTVKSLDQLSDDEAAAVAEVEGRPHRQAKIKLHDKKQALDCDRPAPRPLQANAPNAAKTPPPPRNAPASSSEAELLRLADPEKLDELLAGAAAERAGGARSTIARSGAGRPRWRRPATGASGCCSPGRGFGKTRSGAEWVRAQVERGRARRIALVAPTAADVRDVMIEGESGILAIAPPGLPADYEPSQRRLDLAERRRRHGFSADEPGPAARAAARRGLVRRARGVALSRGLGHADARAAPRQRSARASSPRRRSRRGSSASCSRDPRRVVTRGTTCENRATSRRRFLDADRRALRGHAARPPGARGGAARRHAGRAVDARA